MALVFFGIFTALRLGAICIKTSQILEILHVSYESEISSLLATQWKAIFMFRMGGIV